MKVAQADSAVNVNTMGISILKNDIKKKTMENTKNVSGQFSAPENGNFRCEICNVELTSQVQVDVHLGAKYLLLFFSSRSLRLREKYISLALLVYIFFEGSLFILS